MWKNTFKSDTIPHRHSEKDSHMKNQTVLIGNVAATSLAAIFLFHFVYSTTNSFYKIVDLVALINLVVVGTFFIFSTPKDMPKYGRILYIGVSFITECITLALLHTIF